VKRTLLLVLGLALVAIAAVAYLEGGGAQRTSNALADDDGGARAVLRNAAGDKVGKVKLSQRHGGVQVKVTIDAPLTTVDAGFHGFHVHANDNAANGSGCVPPAFTSADGHLNPGGLGHGNHAGDLPLLLVNNDGSGRAVGEARFETDRFTVSGVIGRALIIHLSPDNYAHIPTRYSHATGTGPDSATLATGDAGDRKACGVIEASD